MRTRVSLFLLLASSLVFLASLFLPWRDTNAPPFSNTTQGLLDQFAADGRSFSGWLGIAGDVTALLVLAIVLATVVTLRRPLVATRLPIGGLGVALGYFAVAVVLEVHAVSNEFSGGFTGRVPTPHTSWAYGFYLGLASAGIAVLSALAFRWDKLGKPRAPAGVAASTIGVGLLVSFLLPWIGFHFPGSPTTPGTDLPAVVIVALGLIVGAGWLHGEAGRRWRLPLAVAAAILTGGAASVVGVGGLHRYGTWIGVGCAVALVALEAVRARPLRLPVVPTGKAALRTGAAVLLIVALFLPWQEFHLGIGANGQGYDGWYSPAGAAAGSLCLLLLAALAAPALESFVLDATVAVAIFVSVLGTAFREESSIFLIGYGAYVGLAAAGILLVAALPRLRPGYVGRRRALARAVPLVASILCIAAVVVPLWFVLPQSWLFQAAAIRGSLAVPGVLLGIYLVRLWADRVGGPAHTGGRLTLVPLVLLTLASLELIRFRNADVIWGAVILVGLCLLLIMCGWIEEEGIRIPEEIWRVDRLPGES